MSRTNPSICCSRCGRIIYEPLTLKDLREKGFAKRISDYYAINDDGRENELCTSCYKAWRSECVGEE